MKRLTINDGEITPGFEIDDIDEDDLREIEEHTLSTSFHLLGVHDQKDHGHRGPKSGIDIETALNAVEALESSGRLEEVDIEMFGIRYAEHLDGLENRLRFGSWLDKETITFDPTTINIITPQPTVLKKHLRKHLNGGGRAKITMVKYGNTYVLMDGNHRFTIAKLLNQKTMEANVLEGDERDRSIVEDLL